MRLLDYADLREKGIKYSRAQLWRLSKAGKLPKPIKLSINRNAWADTDIDEWIAGLIAERDAVEVA
jgi:predicted DNA-binding transcriptional regulator AlpA